MAKWNTTWVNLPVVMLVPITLILSGCATPFLGGFGTKGQSQVEFTRYVEGVFLLENRMTSEIMSLLETDETNSHDALLKAEQHMQEACSALNEYASRDIDGLSIGLFLRRRVEQSATDCEQAALKVKSLLEH